MDTPEYLSIGHVTRDLLPNGDTAAGGTALYTAITAERLGLRTAVLTAAAHLPENVPPTVQIISTSTNTTSTFENRYTPTGRQQWLHAEAPPIRLSEMPDAWRQAPIIHLGPVLHECDLEMISMFPHARVVATPQGWMRQWDSKLPAPITFQPWQPDPALLRKLSAVILSIEDVRGDEALPKGYAQYCHLVALTRSGQGSTLYIDGQPHVIAARPSVERDPTGAGDVFAASFAIRLHETNDPLAAANFASEVAGVSVEGPGISMIPTRDRA